MESWSSAPVALQIFICLHFGMAAFQAVAVVFQCRLAREMASREQALWGGAWLFMGLCHVGYATVALTAPVVGTFIHTASVLPWGTALAGHLAVASIAGAMMELFGVRVGRRALVVLASLAFAMATLPGATEATAEKTQVARYGWQLVMAVLGCLICGPPLLIRGRMPDGRPLRLLGAAVTAYALPIGIDAWATFHFAGHPTTDGLRILALTGCLDFTLIAVLSFSLIQTALERSRRAVEEKLKLEQHLHAERDQIARRFLALIDQVPAGLFVVNRQGYCVNELQPERTPFGLHRSELSRAPLFDLIRERLSPEDCEAARRLFAWEPETGTASRSALLHMASPGGEQVVAVRAHKAEHLGGIAVTTSDVTEQHRLALRLSQVQRLESVGRLAAGVVHELNTLLTVYETTIAALAETDGLTDNQQSLLLELEQATQRGAGLTRQLLAFARSATWETRVHDANGILASFVPVARRLLPEAVELEYEPQKSPVPIKCDRGKLEQVLTNLVTNARDAMPQGGRVTLSVVTLGPESIGIRITDTGEGMDPETLRQATEPFFTTKPIGRGTGLGLSTCREIVEAEGGTLTLSSAPGSGTSVLLRYPKATDEHEERHPTRSEGTPSRPVPGEPVLLVEDDPALRRNLRRVLSLAGYTVQAEADGHAGLTRFLEDQNYVCIVTDIVMPRMTGEEMAAEIWKVHPEVPILFISGYAERASLAHKAARNVRFVPKPFHPERLLQTLALLLEDAPIRDEGKARSCASEETT